MSSQSWVTSGANSWIRVFSDFSKTAHTAWVEVREKWIFHILTHTHRHTHVHLHWPLPPQVHSATCWEQSGLKGRPAAGRPPPEKWPEQLSNHTYCWVLNLQVCADSNMLANKLNWLEVEPWYVVVPGCCCVAVFGQASSLPIFHFACLDQM